MRLAMKKMMRLIAMLLALVVTVSLCSAFAEETVETEDKVLFSVDGMDYYASQVEEMMLTLNDYGYITSDTDWATTIEYIFYTCAEQKKITELGFDQFTEDEEAVIMQEAQSELDALVEEWMTYYQTGAESEEELDELRNSIIDYFLSMGYDVNGVAEEVRYNAAFKKLLAHLEETYELSVTADEVQAYFDEGVAMDKESYEGNVGMYEMYTTYYGVESWYVPTGYRGVLQILLEVDETLLNDYLTKKDSYDAAQSADETVVEGEETPATLEEVQSAYNACIASCQDTIDEIYTRLDNGEAFADLIPEYNIDPGMNNPDNLRNGYNAHPDSHMDGPFLEAAFSEKMVKPGDVSDPSLGMYGIYIVYYLRDVEGGPVELTDEIYTEIETMLHDEKLGTVYNELVAEWAKELEVQYNPDAIKAVTGLDVVDGVLIAPETDEEVAEQE